MIMVDGSCGTLKSGQITPDDVPSSVAATVSVSDSDSDLSQSPSNPRRDWSGSTAGSGSETFLSICRAAEAEREEGSATTEFGAFFRDPESRDDGNKCWWSGKQVSLRVWMRLLRTRRPRGDGDRSKIEEVWRSAIDPTTLRRYYYDERTRKPQWEKVS